MMRTSQWIGAIAVGLMLAANGAACGGDDATHGAATGSSATAGQGGSTGQGGGAGQGGDAGAGGTSCDGTPCGGACVDLKTDDANCGACGVVCDAPLACQDGHCKPPPGGFGDPCSSDADCAAGLCVAGGHCSKTCASAADCPPAPEWTCAPLDGGPDLCQCAPSGPESCNGRDDDCNGTVDDFAPCAQPGYSCQAGACACDPKNLCGGTCVDTQTDAANCGGCGIVCKGTCTGGRCLTTLAAGQNAPRAIAVDATNVYWTNLGTGAYGSVMKGETATGLVTSIAGMQDMPYAIAVDTTSVYWVNWEGSAVLKAPIAGGAGVLLHSGGKPYDVAIDATSVYWTDSAAGTVMKVPLAGGAPVTLASGQAQPGSIAVDATHVYWENDGDGTVVKVPVGGGAAVTLTSGQAFPGRIAVDATSVYWTTFDGGTVMKVPLAGGAPVTLASSQNQPLGIAVDGAHVYWADRSGVGTVMKVPVAGGPAVTLATNQAFPTELAVDANSLYWTNGDVAGKGSVMKLTPK